MENEQQVLIVDDDVDFAESLVFLLEDKQYIVETAATSKQAKKTISRKGIEIVLLDIRLKESNGLELIAALKKVKPNLICVVMTAHTEVETTIESLRHGAYDYLPKPFHPHELFAVLDRCFEKKRLLHENRLAHERYRVLYEENPSMYFTLDENATVLSVNQFGAGELGYEVGELVGQSVLKVFFEEDREAVSNQFKNCLQNPNKLSHWQFRKVRKDGSILWVEEHARCVLNPDGKRNVLIVCNDITKAKEAAVELRDAEIRSRTLLESSPICNKIIDLDSRLQYMSNAGVKGLKIPDIIPFYGTPYPPDFFPEATRTILSEHMERAKTGEVSSVESPALDMEGGEVWYHTTFVPARNDEGQIKYIIVSSVDITERKLAEEELRNSEKRFQSLIESVCDGIIVSDQSGNIVLWNSGAQNMFGYQAKDMLGKPVTEIMPETYRLAHRQGMQSLTETGKGKHFGKTLELEGLRQDGNIFPLEISLSSWQIGETRIFAAIARDITERKRVRREKAKLEAHVHQSQKLETIGTLAGGVAHDFNNMLTAILCSAEFGMNGLKPSHPTFNDLVEIKKAANKASALTSQLLSFSRRQVLKKQFLDINVVMEDLLKMLRRILGEDIELQISLASKLAAVFADPGQMQQILMNLFANARDAMPKGGRLKLETFNVKRNDLSENGQHDNNSKTYVQITISDTGTGIEQENLSHIFEPFFTTKSVDRGTGLGLSVVYGIIKQHEGYIEVESKAEKGATFRIFLPATPGKEAIEIEEKTEHLTHGGDETILIVEDDQIVRDVAVRILNGLNYEVVTAADGREAIDIFREEADKIDLVLLDMVMPKATGPEVYSRLKHIKPSLPVLFVSGYSINSESKEFKDASDFVQKPYTKDILGQKIRQILDRPKKEVPLTKREKEILRLIVEGLTNQEIAGKLIISPRTVDTHRTNIMRKLKIRNTAGLVRFAIENNLLDT